MTPRTFRLYVIVKMLPAGSARWRAAWRCYSKRRKAEGLCQLTAPAELQVRYKRGLWPYDGARDEPLSEILQRQPETMAFVTCC